jgi:hypothetical protein
VKRSVDIDGAQPPGGPPELSADPVVIAFERRLWRNLYAAAGVTVIVGALVTRAPRPALGVALGALLGVFNYRWLRASLRAVLMAGESRAPRGTALKFVGRYVVIGALALVAVYLGRLNLSAIIAGLLAVMVGPPLMEAAYQFYLALTGRSDS